MFSAATILLYAVSWVLILRFVQTRNQNLLPKSLMVLAVGVTCHGIATYQTIFVDDAYQLGIAKILSLFFFVINTIVLFSALKKPLHNLFLFILPLAQVAIVTGELFQGITKQTNELTPELLGHILLSVLAYSLLTIASVQALLLAYQTKLLRQKHPGGVIGLLPPLQTMEKLLFELIWAGEILLTFSIITGILFINDIFVQQLSHKTVFSILSWLIYAILLAGHYRAGWRGPSAIRWTLVGFAALMLAYFGSKLVLEVILGAPSIS